VAEGTIRTLTERGFGFIDSGGARSGIFFHATEVIGRRFDELAVGDAVRVTPAESQKGPIATGVEVSGREALPADKPSPRAPAADDEQTVYDWGQQTA